MEPLTSHLVLAPDAAIDLQMHTIRSSIFLFLPERSWASVNEHVQLIRLCEQHAPFDEIEREARLHKLLTREAYQQRVNKALAAENHEELILSQTQKTGSL